VVRSFASGASDALCEACYRASGGNPFLLNELARSAVEGGDPVGTEQLLEETPERVTREIVARL